jgi:hypothetical protein
LAPTSSTHKKNKTTTKHIPKVLHLHEPIPFPLFLHKSTITPLNDKRQTNNGFWHLNTSHTLNPNNKIPNPFLGYICNHTPIILNESFIFIIQGAKW